MLMGAAADIGGSTAVENTVRAVGHDVDPASRHRRLRLPRGVAGTSPSRTVEGFEMSLDAPAVISCPICCTMSREAAATIAPSPRAAKTRARPPTPPGRCPPRRHRAGGFSCGRARVESRAGRRSSSDAPASAARLSVDGHPVDACFALAPAVREQFPAIAADRRLPDLAANCLENSKTP
jgi:hypothetical protein